MPREPYFEPKPNKDEAPGDPKLRERAERLSEKVSSRNDTPGDDEETPEGKS